MRRCLVLSCHCVGRPLCNKVSYSKKQPWTHTMMQVLSFRTERVNPHCIVCLNVKELLAWSRPHIWSSSNSNGIRTHNHLVHKRTLNHLAQLLKWLSCVVSTYLYGAFDCMLLSCRIRVSEWTPFSKQATYLKFVSEVCIWSLYHLFISEESAISECTVQRSTQNTAQLFG